MSNKKVTINVFDVKSISAAIAEVQRLRESIDTGAKKLVDKLAEDAVKTATEEYETAEYAGEKDVNVASVKTAPLKATVSATGDSVLFIEFGTGINKSDSPEARADLKSGNVVGHGQYGHHLGRLKTGWRYTGSIGSPHPADTYAITEGDHAGMIQTKGNDAKPALYMAKKHANNKFPELVKEVFK